MKSMTVYCGSWYGKDPKYKQAAEILGKDLAKNGINLVYGGGLFGMMGTIGKAVHENGGTLSSITTQHIWDQEHATEFTNEMTGPALDLPGVKPIFVADMVERKRMLRDEGDVICALPGSIGTLDELFEVLVLRYIGVINKPIILLNLDGYYDLVEKQVEKAITEGFTKEKVKDAFVMVSSAEEIVPMAKKMYEESEMFDKWQKKD